MKNEFQIWDEEIRCIGTLQAIAQKLMSTFDRFSVPDVYIIGIPISTGADNESIIDNSKPVTVIPDDKIITEDDKQALYKIKKLSAIGWKLQQFVQRNHESKNVEVFYTQQSVQKNNFLCYTLLEIEKSLYEKQIGISDSSGKRISLLDAVIREYLLDCTNIILKSDKNVRRNLSSRNPDDIMRAAGVSITDDMYWVGDTEEGSYNPFYIFNELAKLKYEKRDCTGKIIYSKRGHPKIETLINFESEIVLEEIRTIRKLLETSENDILLHCNGAKILGLVKRLNVEQSENNEPIFEIHFSGNNIWNVKIDEGVLMEVEHGKPRIKQSLIDQSSFFENLDRIFNDHSMNQENKTNLWKFVDAASQQKHGTLIIISENAESESQRLKSQSVLISPTKIRKEMIDSITAIDGAILLDSQSNCHAIGVILDGIVEEGKGATSRGARYNSALKYIAFRRQKNEKCVAVVVSEDGMIDIIPPSLQKIPRKLFADYIEGLKALSLKKKPDTEIITRALGRICRIKAYLSEPYCKEVNIAIHKIADNLSGHLPLITCDNTLILKKGFTPNNSIDDTHFSD